MFRKLSASELASRTVIGSVVPVPGTGLKNKASLVALLPAPPKTPKPTKWARLWKRPVKVAPAPETSEKTEDIALVPRPPRAPKPKLTRSKLTSKFRPGLCLCLTTVDSIEGPNQPAARSSAAERPLRTPDYPVALRELRPSSRAAIMEARLDLADPGTRLRQGGVAWDPGMKEGEGTPYQRRCRTPAGHTRRPIPVVLPKLNVEHERRKLKTELAHKEERSASVLAKNATRREEKQRQHRERCAQSRERKESWKLVEAELAMKDGGLQHDVPRSAQGAPPQDNGRRPERSTGQPGHSRRSPRTGSPSVSKDDGFSPSPCSPRSRATSQNLEYSQWGTPSTPPKTAAQLDNRPATSRRLRERRIAHRARINDIVNNLELM